LSSTKQDRAARLWYALEVEIEPASREAVEYALMEAGALGTETNDDIDKLVMVTGYFDHTPNRESVRRELAEALRVYDLPSLSVRQMNVREVKDEDWLGEWKKNWQPVEVGRFIIAPPWSEVTVGGDRIVIRIEPGMAFGTGTHETTRLCLKAITRFFKGGSFLDIGTGTGILAIAAAKLFPTARIAACDTDAAAIEIARENARLNRVEERIDFRVGSLSELEEPTAEESTTASADFVCANLTADAISSLLPALISASCGRLILSGILDSQVDAIVDQLHHTGSLIMMQDGEWVAIVV
jgi:ribosomal protein L11 methyltransferase